MTESNETTTKVHRLQYVIDKFRFRKLEKAEACQTTLDDCGEWQ